MKAVVSKHTPSPWHWEVDNWNGGYSGLYGQDRQNVCVPLCRNDGDDGASWFDPEYDPEQSDELQANMDLMEKAPELLEALEAVIDAGWRHDRASIGRRSIAHRHARSLVRSIRGDRS